MAKEHQVIIERYINDFQNALDAASLEGWVVIGFSTDAETHEEYGALFALLTRDKN